MDDEKKSKSFAEKLVGKLLRFILIIATFFLVSILAVGYIQNKTLTFDINAMTNQYFLYIFGGLCLVYLLIWLSSLNKTKPESSGAKSVQKGKVKKFYDTNWLTEKELVSNPIYKFSEYSNLKNTQNIGIPIRAEYRNGKLLVNMYQNIHTLVIGTTGSGKTTQFVDPVMQILSESGKHPCFVVSDPKGEIYTNHSQKLRKLGYNVLVFDLREPFKSTCWNPMTRAYDLNQEAINLPKHVIIHRNEDPRKTNLKLASTMYYAEWYEFRGYAFGSKAELESYMGGIRQGLKNEAFEDLRDIATTLCPIQSQQDPIWDRGAKDMVLATMLAMLEDSENPELGMTREKFNFYNLSKILNTKDNDPYNPIKTICDYFKGRDPLSLSVQLANQIISNNEKTASSYMGIVTDRMSLFGDMGICYATSINEMELNNFCDKPTALFIKIPDEKQTRYPIATMFISQLYKTLVSIATRHGGTLPKDVYFLLDEFGNLPKIEGFDAMITVARSRKIWFLLILQSYAQLTIKYGQEVARTVEDNCNIHIYIASNDRETQKKFSERCGNISVETESTSISKGKDPGKDGKDNKTTNVSVQVESRPLIYPEELGSLKDDFIISILKQPPLKAVFTPAYKIRNWDDPKYGKQSVASIYDMIPAPEDNSLPKTFREHELFYDIKKRNQIILKQQPQNKSGFDW